MLEAALSSNFRCLAPLARAGKKPRDRKHMNDLQNHSYSTKRLVILAFALSIVMAVELAAGNGFLHAVLAGNVPLVSYVLVIFMIITSTSAIVGAITATLKPHPMRVAAAIASGAMAMICGVEASHVVTKLPTEFYFNVSLIGQILITFCIVYVICNKLRIYGLATKNVPFAAAGILAAFGLISYATHYWNSLDKAAAQLSFIRDITLLIAPICLLAFFSLKMNVRLNKTSVKQSLLLRLPDLQNQRDTVAWKLLSGGVLVSALINMTIHMSAIDSIAGHFADSLLVFNLGFFGLIYQQISELKVFTAEQKHGDFSARISPLSAQRFLKRHQTEKNTWAATSGLKTSNYLIDHDPGAILHKNLPASIMQLRSDEIQRCVNDVLGPLNLHNHVVGHRVLGVIDPESSIRSCVDTLKMFAALYLDATPLVERRIKGLIALLPIIDSGLDGIMKTKDIDNLIRRNLWFFHFNFTWIDQHVVHTPKSTRYDVRMATLSSRIRHTMFEHLEKTGGVGNFVWISNEARDRLLHEAPALKNVIETCPISNSKDKDELLMFTLKFEQLIPRLQRYFDLDTMRRSIMDFEPSQESLKLLNLMNLQFSKTRSVGEVRDVLKSITTVPWRGFREKDQALQLILKAHKALNNLLNEGKNICSENSERFDAQKSELLNAVQTIGYPSQILHNAQIDKITLRDIEKLTKVAVNENHSRFHESWLLLSTNDYQRLGSEELIKIVGFIAGVASSRKITKHRIVQIKSVDALVNITRSLNNEHLPIVEDCFGKIGSWFADEKVDSDICCLYLDAHTFISDLFNKNVVIPAPVLDQLDQYFQNLQSQLSSNHPKIIAILSRWQIFRNKRSQVSSAA